MREIKFRAWAPKEKGMVSWKELVSEEYQFDEFNQPKGLVFLQFTGLKDKNGKEIYEGDIVDWVKKGNTYTIDYNDLTGGYQMVTKSKLGHLNFHAGYMEETEVIGNIYENKELLNG